MNEFNDLLAAMEEAAREAGQIAMRYFRRDPKTWLKDVDNPVTAADLEITTFLRERLLAIDPEAGWLSEETADDPARLTKRSVWVVDPIDGTKEFIDGIPYFTILICYLVDNMPMVGLVFNPARDQMFTAIRGQGAYLNDDKIHVSGRSTWKYARVGTSRAHTKKSEMDGHPHLHLLGIGSCGYKMCLVACGAIDASFNRSKLHEWDLAAPVLILKEAGGVTSNVDPGQSQFVFNRTDPYVGGQVSATPELFDEVFREFF